MNDYPEIPLPALKAYIKTAAFQDAASKNEVLDQAAKILSSTDANTIDNELNKSAMLVLQLHSQQAYKSNDLIASIAYDDVYLSFQKQMKAVSSEKPAEPTATTTDATPPTSTSKKGVSFGNLPLVRNLMALRDAAKTKSSAPNSNESANVDQRTQLLEIRAKLLVDMKRLFDKTKGSVPFAEMIVVGGKPTQYQELEVRCNSHSAKPVDNLNDSELKAQIADLSAMKVALLPIVAPADLATRGAEIGKLKELIEIYKPSEKESQQAVREQIQKFVASPDYQQLKKSAENKDNVADKFLLKRIDTLNSLCKQMDNTKKTGGVRNNIISSLVDNRIVAFKNDKAALYTLESNKPTSEAPRASAASKSK